MEEEKLNKEFIPYMSKAFKIFNSESFLKMNIYKLEGLSLKEVRKLLLKEIELAKSMPTLKQRQHLQKVFDKLFSIQPKFEGKIEKDIKNTEQRLYADLIFTPGFLNDDLIRYYLENFYVASNNNSTKAKCLKKIIKLFDNLSQSSIEKFKYCYKSSSILAENLLYNDSLFDMLNDRNLNFFNKETFSQLFRFSRQYSVENIFSELFVSEKDKVLFMISQMSNQLYEQLGHTSEFMYAAAELSPNPSFSKIISEYYDLVVGSRENEERFVEELNKNGMPYEMRELINATLDFSYFYSKNNAFVKSKDLNSFVDFVSKRRENNHINIFGELGFKKFKEHSFSISDFKDIYILDDLYALKDAFLLNIYGINSKQVDSLIKKYAFDMEALEKNILDEDRESFEILKSIISIKKVKLEDQDEIKLIQKAYLKYIEEKGLNYQKKFNSYAVLEGIFNRMYMNTYNSILLCDLKKQKILDVDKGVTIYDAGVDFNMIVTSLNATSKYFENGINVASKWNTAFRDIGQGICTSFISNQNLGVISLTGPLLGFFNIPKDSLNAMGVTDLYSFPNTFNLKNFNNTASFMVGRKMADETRYGYNEIVVERFLSTDEEDKIKLQPDYVVFYKTSERYKLSKSYAQSLKTAKDFGIPMVVVDYYKIKDHEQSCIEEMENKLFSNERVNKDLLVGILTRYMNNISGDRTIHGHPKLGGGGVFKNIYFPEKALGKFIDQVIKRCEETKDNGLRSEWINALDYAYQEEYRKHKDAIRVRPYNCSLGSENDYFILNEEYDLMSRIGLLHKLYDKKESLKLVKNNLVDFSSVRMEDTVRRK